MSYTDVFSGTNIYPSDVSYKAIALSSDVELDWPLETSTGETTARIIDVTPSTTGLSITLSDAREVGNGETILFNNVGANSFVVNDSTGTQIASIAAGVVYQLYLRDNSTAAGTWRTLQFGAAVSSVNASNLAGTGMTAISSLLSPAIPVTEFSADYTLSSADRAKMYVWVGTTGTLTLPSASAVGNNWFFYFRNEGSGAVTVTPSGTDEIDNDSTKAFQPYESAIIISDGGEFYTIGFGQSSEYSFDYTAIDVAGTGDYTLSGNELNRIAYRFTGVLTGDRNIIVPATVQQYWIDNSTTGSYTLTVKISGGTGVVVNTNQRGIYYCNGTDVVDADTSTLGVPIQVSDGGTGATTAGAALINLGGGSTGISIFQSADAATAIAALGGIDGGTF